MVLSTKGFSASAALSGLDLAFLPVAFADSAAVFGWSCAITAVLDSKKEINRGLLNCKSLADRLERMNFMIIPT